MANWFCSVFNVVCVVNVVLCPRCRSELIDSAWVAIVPGEQMYKKIEFPAQTVIKFDFSNDSCVFMKSF